MKIAYLKRTRCNSGGTERVVFNKTNYLLDKGYDVTLITTEHKEKPDFFPFSPKLKRIDLDINYSDLNGVPIHKKIIQYLRKTRTHRRRLTEVLLRERFDVVVTMFGNEIYWINSINDGSRKINEVHFSRNFRTQFNEKSTNWIKRAINRFRDIRDIDAIKRFDLFAVLSNEDKPSWGELPNIQTVYNSVTLPEQSATLTAKRAIAVGRLSYQKGFDMLVEAWVAVYQKHPDWKLDIYGSGQDREALQAQIGRFGLNDVVIINDATPNIYSKMLSSSIYLMTSRYEGFGLVLAEANACGVPAVSFACKCGPRDIITDGESGFLVEQDDIGSFAERVCRLIEDEPLRKKMGKSARKNAKERFSEEVVMKQWEELFHKLTK